MEDRVEAYNEFAAGALGGLAGLVVGHPLDTIKILIQNSSERPSLTKTFGRVKQAGMKSFFRGLSVPFWSYAVINSVLFGTYQYTYKLIDPSMRNTAAMCIAGCIAGGVQLIPAIPVEVLKINMQKDADKPGSSRSAIKCLQGIVKENGVRGLYKGSVANAARDMPACTMYFYTYSVFRDALWRKTELGPLTCSFFAGAMGGTITWMMSVPQDVIKTRMQAGTDKTILACIRSLKKTGMRSFFRGFGLVVLRAFVVNAFTFLVYEAVITELRDRRKTKLQKTALVEPIAGSK